MLRPRVNAFTLIEVLVAIVIVIVLASILLPVFAQAKAQANQAAWMSNYRQVSLGQSLYLSDYDDTFFVARYTGNESAGARENRTWVQLLLPYVADFKLFHNPFDPEHQSKTPDVFDKDLVPGDSLARYYQASQRSNIGYNHLNLAPLVVVAGELWGSEIRSVNRSWRSLPRSISQIANPGNTLVFADSAWQVDSQGRPEGGGSDLVNPPCRTASELRLPAPTVSSDFVYMRDVGWDPEFEESGQAGGVYAWHEDRVTVLQASGHAQQRPLSDMADGCSLAPGWQGRIYDNHRYVWDLE